MKRVNKFFLIFLFIHLTTDLVHGEESWSLEGSPDLFGQSRQQASASAAPQEAATPGKEYEVGVDDVLDINIIKPEPIASAAVVAPDGTITLPYIGNVQAKGQTLSKIQDEVQKRLAGYMEYPVVSVSLRQTRSQKFIIYGQVVQPGAYPVEEGMTLLHAITKAGGFIVPGSTGKIRILRPKPAGSKAEVIKSDITAILSGAKQNIAVLPGDTIVVSVDKFYISGEVNRPGTYPVEENMTLLHAITQAGGFIEPSATGKVRLSRPKAPDSEAVVIDLDIKAVLNGAHQNVIVFPGDSIIVSVDKFYISGQVNRPGSYPVEENMTLLRAITLAGGFVEPSSAGQVKLIRQKGAKSEPETIEFDVASILSGTNQDANVLPGDSIVVSTDKFFVYGEVMRPGMYPLEASTSTLTAISMAGGFSKFGSASRVKVLRMNEKLGAYDTMKVNINDVVAGDPKTDILLQPRDIVVVSEGVF
jgi:polysaccharide export outer membrane protein